MKKILPLILLLTILLQGCAFIAPIVGAVEGNIARTATTAAILEVKEELNVSMKSVAEEVINEGEEWYSNFKENSDD